MRSAVIGCGRMGAFPSESVRRYAPRCWFPLSHAEAILRHPDLELSALCDANSQTLQRAADAYRVNRTYCDYRRMIDEARPELIGIATRTLGRAQIIQHAADHGVRGMHVEKPLCNSVQELTALADTLARTDLFCTYGTIRRFMKIYQTARDLAQSGAYGELREIRVNMGRGLLYWTHPHSVDLILYAAAERTVASVQARLGNVVPGGSPLQVMSDPFIVSASIYFADGIAGHITQAPGNDLILSCSEGEVIVENDGRDIRIAARQGEDPYLARTRYQGAPESDGEEGTLAPMAQLADCLSGDAAAARRNEQVKFHMLEGQRILFAMIQSHWEHSRLVKLTDIDPALMIYAKTGEQYA